LVIAFGLVIKTAWFNYNRAVFIGIQAKGYLTLIAPDMSLPSVAKNLLYKTIRF
jgi:hypothetical protein